MPNPHNPHNPHNPDSAEREFIMADKLYFDIETGPRADVLANPSAWYKPDARLKDPEKIAADLSAKAEDAALHPTTGEILAIGYATGKGEAWEDLVSSQTMGESECIGRFLNESHEIVCNGGRIMGWNSHDFDIPYVIFRARVLGVNVPVSLFSVYRSKLSFNDAFLDLMLYSQCGRFKSDGFGLDRVAKSLGLGGKIGNGADFHKLLKTDPAAARQYLRQDVALTKAIGERMGL